MARKVTHPGSKLAIKASEWNAAQAAGEAYKHTGKFGNGPVPLAKGGGVDITFLNTSSTRTFDRGELVWLGDPAPSVADNEDAYLTKIVTRWYVLDVNTGFNGYYPGRFGILLDSIPSLGSGRVRMAGIADLKVDATFAAQFAANASYVMPMARNVKPVVFGAGPMELLYMDTAGDVADRWARVRFPVPCLDVLCRATADIANEATFTTGDLVLMASVDDDLTTPPAITIQGRNRSGTFVMTDDRVRIRRRSSTALPPSVASTGTGSWEIVANETHQGTRDGTGIAVATAGNTTAGVDFTTASGDPDTIQVTALTGWSASDPVMISISPTGKAMAAKVS